MPARVLVADSDSASSDHDSGSPLLCRLCRAPITSRSWMMEVNGAHRHVFANPHGKVFAIGCFSAAPGCINHGVPTMECTWFTGCAWRHSLCAVCSAHLGWQYRSSLSGVFWGLILDMLIEG